jgi:hypothetical protein
MNKYNLDNFKKELDNVELKRARLTPRELAWVNDIRKWLYGSEAS